MVNASSGARELVLRGRRVLLPGGAAPASVHVAGGVIAKIDDYDAVPAGACPVVDAGELVLMPGVVDTHVHVNDPGRADWEGWDTATRAAAAGGVTTLMDMPLNSIPATTTPAALEAKARAAAGRCWVDYALCGGLVPASVVELRALRDAGVLAFKCFLTESGVDEFPHVDEASLRAGMRVLADLGAPLLVHAELSGPIDAALAGRAPLSPAEARRYVAYLESRPRAAENEAVSLVTRLSRELRARTHIVHLSSADALLTLRDAHDAGVPITAETCPHYLTFASEEIPDGKTEYKCAPPIRESGNRERLWGALRGGAISQVVTDHSPAPPLLKCAGTGDFMSAWGGIASLQVGLRAVWTEARARGAKLEDVVEWMCTSPARLVGIERTKGSIAVGRDADFVLFDPDAEGTLEVSAIQHRHKLTPYVGRALRGRVLATYVRGARVFDVDVVGTPSGRWVKG